MKALILLFSMLFAGAVSAQGVSIRGGGHEIGLEFTNAFAAATEEIRKNHPDLWAKIQAEGVTELPANIRIYVENEPIKVEAGEGQQDSVAANDPTTVSIWINSERWSKVIHPRVRQAIALHEVYSLKMLEKTGYYPVSGAYLAKFNLRNDTSVFITGQDPSLPQWKSRRVNCERRYTLKNEQTGKILQRTDFSLYAQADWNILDRIYSIQFIFATETGGNWPNPVNSPSFIQKIQTTVSKNGNETLSTLSGHQLMIQNKQQFTDDISQERYWLSEKQAGGKTIVWDWKNGKKGAKSKASTESTLSDGSTRTVTEDLQPVYFKPVRQTEGIIDCVDKIVPGEEWLALAGDTEMGAAVEKLNARALMVYEANLAYKACSTGGCDRLKNDVDLQERRFDETWNGIFQQQKAKLKTKLTEVRSPLLPRK
jgi:hypothetical protein